MAQGTIAQDVTQEQARQAETASQVSESPGGARNQRRGTDFVPAEIFRINPIVLMNPFSLVTTMSEELDRALSKEAEQRTIGGEAVWAPAIELAKRDNEFVIRAELPGVQLNDVKVEAIDNTVIIQGERRFDPEEHRNEIHRTERRYGRFYRLIELPEGADLERARATMHNGILEIIIPRTKQHDRPKEIPIEADSASPAAQTQA